MREGPDRAQGKTVVVADDDADVRDLVTEHFERQGYSVLQASNGLEALLHVKRSVPAIVVLDLTMPRLGGLDALKRIVAFNRAIVVILLTEETDAAIHREALSLGARAVLEKPVSLPALLQALGGTAAAPRDATAILPTRRAPTEPAPVTAKTEILIVDDDPGTSAVLEEFLARCGYAVRGAADAAAALRAIVERPPAVVLLDIEMPGMRGIDALPAIHSLAPTTAVIMITGVDDTAIAQQALARGAFDYITKPPDPSYLVQTLEAAVASS